MSEVYITTGDDIRIIADAIREKKRISNPLMYPEEMAQEIRTISTGDHEYYTGEYDVTPDADEEQVLQCEEKIMQHDVVVRRIPYEETSNESGGYTAVIGGY